MNIEGLLGSILALSTNLKSMLCILLCMSAGSNPGDAMKTLAETLTTLSSLVDALITHVDTIVETYLNLRQPEERFLDTYRRVGMSPFKEQLYAD